jgi:hypothetical protein
VPARFTHALENLKNHGIKAQALEADREFDVEIYRIDGLQKAARTYEGHNLATVEVTPRKAKMKFEAGTVLVRTGQPLGTLAALLLEPQSEDGLCTWNFFDDGLAKGGDFPVVRIPEPFRILKTVAK